MRYYCIFILLFLFSCKENSQKLHSNSLQSPNIIFIYTDDLGYGDLSCFGSDSIATPYLDAMAENFKKNFIVTGERKKTKVTKKQPNGEKKILKKL